MSRPPMETPETGEAPTIRLGRRADGSRCNAFYNLHYARTRSLQQWEWEFCRREYADGTIPFAVAEFAGEVVGTQALIPIQLIDAAGPYWSAKSEETLVAGSMRGRGLFHQLYEPLLSFAQSHGLESIWGFTPARSAFEREGFGIPVRTSQLLRPFSSDAAEKLLASAPGSKPPRFSSVALSALSMYATARAAATRAVGGRRDVTITALDQAPDWADELSQQFVRTWGGTTIHRSADYMSWRFFGNPFRRPLVHAAFVGGAPVGWVAFGLGSSGVAAIVDLVVVPAKSGPPAGDIVSALVETAVERSRDMGAAAIRAWDVTRHPFSLLVRRVVRDLGWIRMERGFDMVLKSTPGIAAREQAQPIDQWYISRAFTEGSDV